MIGGMSISGRLSKRLFWAFACYTPIGLAAALVAGVYQMHAAGSGFVSPDSSTGHVVPFVVGRAPPRVVYVTGAYATGTIIAQYMFLGWLAGAVALVTAGMIIRRREKTL
jgi:hypothetical protein